MVFSFPLSLLSSLRYGFAIVPLLALAILSEAFVPVLFDLGMT